jgi:hypothetical protein
MQAGPIVGLLGDLLTFTGGLLLAWDAVQKEREFERIKKVAAALQSPWLARLKVEMEGLIVADEGDVQKAFIRRSARKAAYGCGLLAAGFLLLLAARTIELLNHVQSVR